MNPSRMRPHDLPAWSLGLGLGLSVWALYQNTLASVHYPDAIAYARQVEQHQLFHPHHLLYNLMGYLAARASAVVWPTWDLMDTLQQVNALIGAAGAGGLCWWLARHTGRMVLPLVFGAGLALLYGWWSVSVTWEVHVLSPVLLLAALAALVEAGEGWGTPRAQGVVLGGLLALAVLFHQTAALAGPGLLAAAWALGPDRRARRQRCAALVLSAALLVGGGYAAALRQPHLLAARSENAVEFALRDALQAHPDAGDPSRTRAMVRGLTRVGVYLGPPRCAFGNAEPDWTPEADRLPGLAAGGLLLAAAGSLGAARRELGGRYRPAAVMLGGWALVALPFILWWEPANYEYSLGLGAALLAVSGLGLGAVQERWGGGFLRQNLTLLPWIALLGLVGVQNLRQDLGPASWVGGDHRQCSQGGRERKAPTELEGQAGPAPTGAEDGPRGPSPSELSAGGAPAATAAAAEGGPVHAGTGEVGTPQGPATDPSGGPEHPAAVDDRPERQGGGERPPPPPENARPGRTRH